MAKYDKQTEVGYLEKYSTKSNISRQLLSLFYGFKGYDEDVTHVITFVLLAMIGSNMIKSARNNDECECIDDALDTKNMFVSALATSIDAMAVGVTFSLLQVNILLAIALIGIITFILSTLGVLIGHKFGLKYKSKAEMTGGIMLLLLGIKILLESM